MAVRRNLKPVESSVTPMPTVRGRGSATPTPMPTVRSRGVTPMPTVKPRPSTPNPRFSDFASNLGLRASKQGDQQGPSYDPMRQKRDFQPYGVGKPRYNAIRSAPNVGPVTGKEGYKERDLRNRVLKARTQKLLKKRQMGRVTP